MKPQSLPLVTLALAGLLGACGPSLQEVRKARESAYYTDYVTVWNAVQAEMLDRFHADGIKSEDATNGVIESKWKGIEVTQDSTDGISDQRKSRSASSVRSGNMMRIVVKIVAGGPPWKVVVDGEAAQFRPNMAMLTPYQHGALDEPHWVPGKIDSVRVGIHERLKAYAASAGPGPAAPADPAGPTRAPAGGADAAPAPAPPPQPQ